MLKTRRGQVLGSAPNMTGAALLEFISAARGRTPDRSAQVHHLLVDPTKTISIAGAIGAKAVAWIASEVAEWQASRVAARNNRGEAA